MPQIPEREKREVAFIEEIKRLPSWMNVIVTYGNLIKVSVGKIPENMMGSTVYQWHEPDEFGACASYADKRSGTLEQILDDVERIYQCKLAEAEEDQRKERGDRLMDFIRNAPKDIPIFFVYEDGLTLHMTVHTPYNKHSNQFITWQVTDDDDTLLGVEQEPEFSTLGSFLREVEEFYQLHKKYFEYKRPDGEMPLDMWVISQLEHHIKVCEPYQKHTFEHEFTTIHFVKLQNDSATTNLVWTLTRYGKQIQNSSYFWSLGNKKDLLKAARSAFGFPMPQPKPTWTPAKSDPCAKINSNWMFRTMHGRMEE